MPGAYREPDQLQARARGQGGHGLASVTRLPVRVDPSIAKEHHEVGDREGGSPGTTFALTCVVRPPFGGSLAVTNAHLANTSVCAAQFAAWLPSLPPALPLGTHLKHQGHYQRVGP